MSIAVRSRRVGSGLLAEIRADRWQPGAYELILDGTAQSHVLLSDPSELFFEYVRRMGHVIDLVRPGREPVNALHLGAGALSLPRYIDATRPGSRQQVIELDRELVDFVREALPWDRQAAIRLRYGDARAMLDRLPSAMLGSMHVIVVDVFAGARTPPQVTSIEFYRRAVRYLRADGVILVNVADGPPMPYARSQATTLAAALAEEPDAADPGTTVSDRRVVALAESGVAKRRRFGNIVLAGSPSGIPTAWLDRLRAAGPHPGTVIAGDELERFAAGAPVVTDATATGSPEPGRGVLRR